MDKEKEIEEMFDILDRHIMLEHKAFTDNIVGEWDAAKAIVEAGYRKADDVRKETIREILYAVDDEARGTTSEVTRVLRRRYGVEVDE